MSKVYNYIVLAVVLTFLLKFAGIPSGADSFISWIGLVDNPSGVSLGAFFLGVAAVFVAGVATSRVTIGFFTSQVSTTSITAVLCGGIFTVIVSTFISVVNYTASIGGFVYYITFIFFVPFIIGFATTIIDFWRGTG